MSIKTYAEAGVNIDKGDKFAQFIASIKSKAVSKGIGGFAGGIELDISKYKTPVLLSSTDGVGTKLLLTKEFGIYDTIGIDLVAMSVNDLIVCGAEPLNFLDYIACGKINDKILKDIIKGIVKGCEEGECILAGGETAEMPDVYKEDEFDLAGFCVGIVEKDKMLPKKNEIKRGDVILGLPSSGVHSNGLSLARKVIPEKDKLGRATLLKPTKIYVKQLKKLIETDMILSAAHITGGGLEGNLKRTIPNSVRAVFNYSSWQTPDIFKKIMKDGGIAEAEMRKVFNMGIGMALIAHKENVNNILSVARKERIDISVIGELK
jgi:phosphoribosylformylglycinamidine cyclo-ligase